MILKQLLTLLALIAVSAILITCSDDDDSSASDSDTDTDTDSDSDSSSDGTLPDPFTQDVQDSLPVHTGDKLTGELSRDAYSYTAETYEEALGFGGAFERTMGNYDPASVYMYLAFSDLIIQDILGSDPETVIGDSATLTLPFLGDEVAVDHTYSYPGTYLYIWKELGKFFIYLDNLEGGYTDTDLVASFTFSTCFKQSDDPQNDPICDTGHMIFLGARGNDGELVVKSTRHQFENGEDTSAGRIEYERASTDSHGVLKAVSKYNNNNEENVFSINVSGKFDNFIIRRRSYQEVDSVDHFIDQFFVTSFDEKTGEFAPAPLDEWSDDSVFDVDGGGFNATAVTSSETEQTYLDDVNASNMFDFSEPTVLPSSQGDIIPTDW